MSQEIQEIQAIDATRGWYYIHPTRKMSKMGNNALWVGPFTSYPDLLSAVKSEFGEGVIVVKHDRTGTAVGQSITDTPTVMPTVTPTVAPTVAPSKIVTDVMAYLKARSA